MLMFGVLAIALIWPSGVIVISIAWLKGRGGRGRDVPRPTNPPKPRMTRYHEGSDADAVLAAAAMNVAEWQTAGLSLVEAAWVSGPTTDVGGPFRLGVAFGNRKTQFARLWPDDEDAMEAVLARVPGTLTADEG